MYQQGVFFNGGMNTDDEDRLIPNGDYRYATFSRNYGVNTPMEGAIQSMTGNTLQENTQLAAGVNIIIGSCEDIEHKALILFIWNEYNDHSIWRYTVEDAQYELILQDGLLNFKKDNKIYHAAVVNNLLYWTDNYFGAYLDNDFNPPRKINIQKAILYTQSGGTDPDGYSEITFNNLDWIKHPPLFSPDPVYFTDTTETANNLKNKLFQFRYQYVYDDNEESAWSPISELILPPNGEYISQTVGINPFLDNTILLDISTGSSITRLIRVAYRIGNTGEFFLYEEYNKIQLGWGDYSTETINFKNEISGVAISNSERNYDLVPQIAKTIEYLPSSEFAIGNYIEGYDKQEITDHDIQIEVSVYPIEETAFTEPMANFINAEQSGSRYQVISLGTDTGSGASFNLKYRYQPGDILILQLKNLVNSSGNSSVKPDSALYFKIPVIDGSIYSDDMSKVYALNDILIQFLALNGIGAVSLPAGTISVSGTFVMWETVRLTGKTWFNQTQSQLNTTNTSDYVQKITILRDNKATRTFKTGATHEFAIQYYDRANRDGTVLTTPAGKVYNKFYSDYSDNFLNLPCQLNRKPFYTTMSMSISAGYQPPIWATNYQVLYRPSVNIANFQQRSVKSIIYNPDNTLSLVLEDYYKNGTGGEFVGVSINQTPSKGDLVRFVRQRALFTEERSLLISNGLNIGLTTRNIVGSIYSFRFIGYDPLFPAYDDVNVICDPDSNSAPPAAFNSVATSVYEFVCDTSFTISWPVGYSDPSSIKVNVFAWRLDTGAVINYIGGNIFYDLPTNGMSISVHQNSIFTILSGLPVSYGINVEFIGGGGPGTYPPSATLNISSYQMSVYNGFTDYDNSNYYPKYIPDNVNKIPELNVMLYDPAGGPNGEETVIVNYFDSNLLGSYLKFGGTDESRPLASGGFQIEIYTPKKESENDPWYEVGIEFPIIDPHSPKRSHGGDVNQVYPTIDGQVALNCGDVYIRQRIMSTGYHSYSASYSDAQDNRAAWFCEDPHYSDFYTSNWNNKGRVGLFSPFAKKQHLKASIYHTNALIDNTQINGLSRIEFFNNVTLKDEHGEINKLMQIGDTLKAFQDKKISSIYIQKAFALNGDGTNNVIISDKTFAGVRPHDDDYGCIHPGSVAKVENNVFFYDFYNAAVVQATQGGLVNVCDGPHKFSVGIRSFTNDIRDYELTNGEPINITSHINRSNGEYILYSGTNLDNIPRSRQFEDFDIILPNFIILTGDYVSYFEEGTVFTITGADDPGNNGTYTVAVAILGGGNTNITVFGSFASNERKSRGIITIMPNADLSGQNIVYSFNRQRWSSYMLQPVLWATQFGNRAYTVGGNATINMGKLYEEDGGGELNFFNEGRMQQIDFLFNLNPTIVKRFLTFMTQSNIPFSVNVSIPPTNQYSGGMSSNILIDNFRNQESYYVSKYFRDMSDPNPFLPSALKRLNGRELRGYVLDHSLTNSDTINKMILFSANVNFVPSEPLMQ